VSDKNYDKMPVLKIVLLNLLYSLWKISRQKIRIWPRGTQFC